MTLDVQLQAALAAEHRATQDAEHWRDVARKNGASLQNLRNRVGLLSGNAAKWEGVYRRAATGIRALLNEEPWALASEARGLLDDLDRTATIGQDAPDLGETLHLAEDAIRTAKAQVAAARTQALGKADAAVLNALHRATKDLDEALADLAEWPGKRPQPRS